MNKALFETNIIDPLKKDSHNWFKIHVGLVHTAIFYFVGMLMNRSDSTFGVILFTILILGSVFLFAFVYAKTPSRGKLLFYEDSLRFIDRRKNDTTINLANISNLSFYIDNNKYTIGIVKGKKEYFFDLDIVFINERKTLNEVIEKWIVKGYPVEVVNNRREW